MAVVCRMFDSIEEEVRAHRLAQLGNPLKALERIDWARFGALIHKAFDRERVAANGGAPRYADELMFKILVLQRYQNIGDEQMEYLVTDRTSYRRFLGLASDAAIPDSRTIQRYRGELAAKAGLMDALFADFLAELGKLGLVPQEGVIIDATFIEAPRQRNSREDNATIKAGGVPEEWKKPEAKAMLRQKDVHARWTKKRGQRHYGYKMHAKVGLSTKLILATHFTPANVHDSHAVEHLVGEADRGKAGYFDAAYNGERVAKVLGDCGVVAHVIEQGRRNHPLTEAQKACNRAKSVQRSRVEHVFGSIATQMGGSVTRLIGAARNRFHCVLTALTYNILRRFQLASPCPGMAR